jgi:tetratricopeptide (TPR) repeat protein
MLASYREGSDDATVFRTVLRSDPEAFDKRFAAYVEERFGEVLKVVRVPAALRDSADFSSLAEMARSGVPGPDDVLGQLMEGAKLFREQRLAQAKPFLERAKMLFPENTSGGGPYRMLAEIRKQEGDARGAIAELRALTALDENAYEENLLLAELLESQRDTAGAAEVLERVIYMHPYDVELHQRLATMRAASSDWAGVVRARRALVALNPVDMPEALYELALAYFNAGDQASARREVLRALEEAPSFAKAQELLLRISGSQEAGR